MASDPSGTRVPGGFGELAANALRYWEPRRLIYNAVLLAVGCAHFIAGWPASRGFLARDPPIAVFDPHCRASPDQGAHPECESQGIPDLTEAPHRLPSHAAPE